MITNCNNTNGQNASNLSRRGSQMQNGRTNSTANIPKHEAFWNQTGN